MTGLVAAMVASGGVVLAGILIAALVVTRRPFRRVSAGAGDDESVRAAAEVQAQIDRGRSASF